MDERFRLAQAYLDAHKAELLAKYNGKWGLFRDGNLEDVFDGEDEAVHAGLKRFPDHRFCLIQIVMEEEPVALPLFVL